jgi:hypothetical protein
MLLLNVFAIFITVVAGLEFFQSPIYPTHYYGQNPEQRRSGRVPKPNIHQVRLSIFDRLTVPNISLTIAVSPKRIMTLNRALKHLLSLGSRDSDFEAAYLRLQSEHPRMHGSGRVLPWQMHEFRLSLFGEI